MTKLNNIIKTQQEFNTYKHMENLVFINCNAVLTKHDSSWLYFNSNITFKNINYTNVNLKKHYTSVFSFNNCAYCQFICDEMNKISNCQFSNFTTNKINEFVDNSHSQLRIIGYDGYVSHDNNSFSNMEFLAS